VRKAELREQWRKWRASNISPEPETGVRLALNMPASRGGGRVIRKFANEATLEELYGFAECYDLLEKKELLDDKVAKPEGYEHKYSIQVASLMPRETFPPSQDTTIGEKMGKGGSLVVEDVDDEDA
jgi:FAS-associated factor 2